MLKIEAVVVRDRVEPVMDAVTERTGHVGVTVLEAVGHGRQPGITHEYRGRVFESRFLPKALLVFLVDDGLAEAVVETIVDTARTGYESGDGIVWTTPVLEARHNRTGRVLEAVESMTNAQLAIAASTIWVVVAAILVMFMQAGFAFLETGLTRMKNVGHVAAKNVLLFGLASLVYYLVGFGIAFGDGGNGLFGGSGFLPDVDDLLAGRGRRRSPGSRRCRPARRTSSRRSSPASRSRSSGARWPSGRSCGSTSPSASSSR